MSVIHDSSSLGNWQTIGRTSRNAIYRDYKSVTALPRKDMILYIALQKQDGLVILGSVWENFF